MKYKLRGTLLVNHIIRIIVILLMTSGSLYASREFINNYKADRLVAECDAIDRALLKYSESHIQVLENSITVVTNADGNQVLQYTKVRAYPVNLNELRSLQAEQGSIIDFIDLDKFTYTTTTDSNGQMTYSLGVTMPNGTVYTSPFSNKKL